MVVALWGVVYVGIPCVVQVGTGRATTETEGEGSGEEEEGIWIVKRSEQNAHRSAAKQTTASCSENRTMKTF